MTQSIEQRVGLIERRLERIEMRLDLEPLVELAPIITPAIPALDLPVQNPVSLAAEALWGGKLTSPETPPATDSSSPLPDAHRRTTPPPLPVFAATPASPTVPPLAHPVPLADKILPYVSRKPIAPARQGALEQTIGLKWAGWVGAVVLSIGAALGVKFAYDQHWFGQLPIWIWPSIIAAAGFALIGAGEYVYRKVNIVPAASLFGAGIATLFLVSYVGYSYYHLYSNATAFALMALTTLIGSGVAMRGRLASIAVLAQIGGNIAPLIMGSSPPPHTSFMIYLLMLQIIALTLAWWGRSSRWWTLRGLSLATTSLWISGLIFQNQDGMLPLWFSIGYAILYHAEVIISARRADADSSSEIHLRQSGAVFVVLVIAALTGAVLTVLADSSPWTRAAWVIGLAGGCSALGFVLDDMTRRLTSALSQAYRAAAVTLLTISVPIAFDGMSVEIAWATVAIVTALLGRAIKSNISRAGAVVMWCLALLHVVTSLPGIAAPGMQQPLKIWMMVSGVQISSAAILCWGLVIVGHIIAALLQTNGQTKSANISTQAAMALSAAASFVWLATSILALPPLGATLMMIAYAWLMLGIDIPLPRLGLIIHAIAMLMAAMVKWVVIDTLAQRLSPTWSAATYIPIFNPLMGVGLLLAGSLVAIYWLRRSALELAMPSAKASPLAAELATIVVVLLSLGLSFEIDRIVERAVLAGQSLTWPVWQLKQMAWTMLWSIAALILGFIFSRMSSLAEKHNPWVRAVGMFSACLIVKFLVIDTLIYHWDASGALRHIIFNLQTLTAAVVIGVVSAMRILMSHLEVSVPADKRLGARLTMLALFVVAWTGTFEIDRIVAAYPVLYLPWPRFQFVNMAWTIWWTICAAGGFVLGRRIDPDAIPKSGWVKALPATVLAVAIKFMALDALFWRVIRPATLAPVLGNMQAMAASVLLAGLIIIMVNGLPGAGELSQRLRVRFGFVAALLALLTISLEIDRAFEGPAAATWFIDPRLAKQVAFSICWSVFAVGSVAVGFRIRLAPLRYFGLALLALTLLKVVTLDLGQVATGYRILSFLALGLLMLGTSVLYGKLSPRLLK